MELSLDRVRMAQYVSWAAAATVSAFWALDVALGGEQTLLRTAMRLLMLAALVPTALFLRIASARAADRIFHLVAVVLSVALGLMTLESGGTSSPSFSFLWVAPFVMSLMFLERPSIALVSGITATLSGLLVILNEGATAVVTVKWLTAIAACSAIAYLAARMYRRIHQRDLAAIRASQARLEQILQSLPLGVVVRDSDGSVHYENTYARKLTGHVPSQHMRPEVMSQTYGLVLRGTEIACPTERLPVVHALGGRTHGSDEVDMVLPDGRRIPLEIHAAPLVNEAGAVQGAVVAFRDVSEREHLKRQVIQADRLTALGTLSAGMAHEINNPLAFVASNLHFANAELRDPGLPADDARRSELVQVMEDALEGTRRIQAIVRQLREFSRRDDPAVVEFDLHDELEAAITMAMPQLRGRATLVRELGTPPLVRGSSQRFGQVLLNLLINAAQAIPRGDASRHEVRVVTRAAEDGSAVVEVRDTGCGIPAAAMPRIFDPFFTTKAVGEGTGLGLAVCHGIIEAMRGRIEVDSRVGAGTTFRLVLPAAMAHVSEGSLSGQAALN